MRKRSGILAPLCDEVNYDAASRVVLEICAGSERQAVIQGKLLLMAEEKWSVEDVCQFWSQHLMVDSADYQQLHERFRVACFA